MNISAYILSNAGAAIDDDGWALIAPFGEHPKTRVAKVNGIAKTQKFIQVLDNASADALTDPNNGIFRTISRARVGIPVYAGHPDLRDHAPETLVNRGEPKSQIGVVDQVRKASRGIEARFVLSPDGANAVENGGAKYPSALWMVQPCGQRGDATLARPFKLLSVGLTANPNIDGVESLANSSDLSTIAIENARQDAREFYHSAMQNYILETGDNDSICAHNVVLKRNPGLREFMQRMNGKPQISS